MYLKQTLIAGLFLAVAGAVVPSDASAQTWRDQVCAETTAFLEDRRAFVRADIREIRTLLRTGDLTEAERRALRREVVQLRSRRQLLRVAERRLERGRPSASECRRLDVFITRVASYT